MLTFPELRGAQFGHMNLDLLAQEYRLLQDENLFPRLTKQGVTTNPLLDPQTCLRMVQDAHARLGIDHSYGGWFEDRRVLWKDSYLEKGQHWIHLGVDFTVPTGTSVAATWKGTVEHVDDDTPEPGGWGPRVIVRLKDASDMILIFAHLGKIICKKGDRLKPGDVFAEIGAPPNNGMWFPHLHVQAVDLRHYKRNWNALVQELDGYANPFEASRAATIFPDPMRYVRLWN
ncbi:MAG: M23 family metallopeptidase [Candidatus Uhrbacteria bacterium]|nr:M23 family metallopeptidase [Candidatus Uhrbacteria bacterium]